MESLLDRASPRRGSLNSLHRYPSGSSSNKHGSPSNTLQVNSTNLYALCKDLDKFTRYFIVKAVQVIVQSRINGSQKIKTDCKPGGNDWFNLHISDIVEVSDKTKTILDTEGLSVKSNWRVCCEISLKTADGSRMVLEHWIISNRTNFNSNQKLSSGQASPKGYLANRTSNYPLTSSNGIGGSLSNAPNTTGRIRTATFSSPSRARLNSIDDNVGNINVTNNEILMDVNNENIDIKTSTSCFSLSSGPTTTHQFDQNSPMAGSSKKNTSITNMAHTNSCTTQQHQQDTPLANTNNNGSCSQNSANKTNAYSSIYTIYNRMSLLLKTLLTTTHIVPAYRIASRTSQTDSCAICYRVYVVPRRGCPSRGSIEDINSNLNHLESPNKRSSASTSSIGSIDIRDFVSLDELEHFCPIFKLGSIRTDINELDVSVCYRTDMRSSTNLLKNYKSKEVYNRMLDDDCIIAAKQLLAGNECLRDTRRNQEHLGCGSNNSLSSNGQRESDQKASELMDQPLRPAFADTDESRSSIEQVRNIDNSESQSNDVELIETAFRSLLQTRTNGCEDETTSACPNKDDDLINIANKVINKTSPRRDKYCGTDNGGGSGGHSKLDSRSLTTQSEPIQVPGVKNVPRDNQQKDQNHRLSLTPSSTPKSLTDSYVFVDLSPPFASDEQNDINSFFHGPSPTFSNGLSSVRDVDELTSQLASIEANASQIDDFVDNICASEDDEEKVGDDR